MKKDILIVLLVLVGLVANAQEYRTVKDISFTTKNDAYAQNGHAYVFDRFVGLEKGSTCPPDYDKEQGWVAKSFFFKKFNNILICEILKTTV